MEIFFKGHPFQFLDTMKSEKSSRDDGLIQRFMICAPKPVFLTAEDINNAPDIICSLDLLLGIN